MTRYLRDAARVENSMYRMGRKLRSEFAEGEESRSQHLAMMGMGVGLFLVAGPRPETADILPKGMLRRGVRQFRVSFRGRIGQGVEFF